MRNVTDSGCSVYSLFSALIMHVYQMRSSNQVVVTATQQRLTACMNALKDVSKVWLVAKMVHTLFESILGNKVLEDRLQKAAGRQHRKSKHGSSSKASKETPTLDLSSEAQKRKFDDMEMGYTNGPPAPQMSYERSRPQSPAITPSRELPQTTQASQQQQIPHITAGSPTIRQGTDAFMGTSRANTRPTTPFNNFSYPGTPPDLFLHTRNSPKISEDLWQNYQPEQLFPPETSQLFPISTSPNQMVDPALRDPSHPPQMHQQQFAPQQPNMQQQGPPMQHNPSQQQHTPTMSDGHSMASMSYQHDPNAWAHINMQNQQRPDDQWSNSASSTQGGPIVPTTLNVGDWFEFFGIPAGSDLGAFHNSAGYG